jgi:hypothetical protein
MNKENLYKSLAALLVCTIVSLNGICQVKEAKITYASFTVNQVNKKIAIDWVTNSKATANYFEIQRSLDGKNFTTIALVMGPDPQKPDGDCYECFDKPLTKKQNCFYRLRHIDVDGEVEVSETKMLAIK